MEKTNKLLENLRRQKPELHDSNLLTDRILNITSKNSIRSTSTILIWIRTISSAAAVLLLALYLYQIADNQMDVTSNTSIYVPQRKIDIESDCIQRNKNLKINLIKSYFCYVQQNSIKKRQLLSYYQQFNNFKNENND